VNFDAYRYSSGPLPCFPIRDLNLPLMSNARSPSRDGLIKIKLSVNSEYISPHNISLLIGIYIISLAMSERVIFFSIILPGSIILIFIDLSKEHEKKSTIEKLNIIIKAVLKEFLNSKNLRQIFLAKEIINVNFMSNRN
jgi:hypothetical protein